MKSCKLHKLHKLLTDIFFFVRANNIVSEQKGKDSDGQSLPVPDCTLMKTQVCFPAPLISLRRRAEDTGSLSSCSSSDCSRASPHLDLHTALDRTDSCRVGSIPCHTHCSSFLLLSSIYDMCDTHCYPPQREGSSVSRPLRFFLLPCCFEDPM